MDEAAEKVKQALKSVIDPELNLSIVDLGLVYEIKVEGGKAAIKMTLTSPFCPVGPQILSGAKAAAESVDGVSTATVQLTFTPPWNPTMATDEIKAMFEHMM